MQNPPLSTPRSSLHPLPITFHQSPYFPISPHLLSIPFTSPISSPLIRIRPRLPRLIEPDFRSFVLRGLGFAVLDLGGAGFGGAGLLGLEFCRIGRDGGGGRHFCFVFGGALDGVLKVWELGAR